MNWRMRRACRPGGWGGTLGPLLLAALGACNQPEKRDTPSAPASSKRCTNDCALAPQPGALASLLAYEDTNGDRRITIADEGPKRFELPLLQGQRRVVEGVYPLANLVQELYLGHQEGRDTFPESRLSEATAERLSRLIQDRYWKALTRRIDSDSLEQVLTDSKTDGLRTPAESDESWPDNCTPPPQGRLPQFLYVPHDDPQAHAFYTGLLKAHPALVVCRLPATITPAWVSSLSAREGQGSRHGLLSLALHSSTGSVRPVPYVVPGGRFNELYGWDSYFHVRGLLADGQLPLAQGTVDNQLYELEHYGKVLNANRTYYLTRSQPPLLSSAVRALWETGAQSPAWLRNAVTQLRAEYRNVWQHPSRLTPLCTPTTASAQGASSSPAHGSHADEQDEATAHEIPSAPRTCLAVYGGDGLGEPPEVEEGHFDWMYAQHAERSKLSTDVFRKRYLSRQLPPKELEKVDWFFRHDRCMRESGHDTTYRWTTQEGDRCADFATVDLNALLFKMELDLAQLSRELGENDWPQWCARASARRQLIQRHLWNGDLFVDYQLERDAHQRFSGEGARSSYISATTLFPLWASVDSPCREREGTTKPLSLLTGATQAQRLVRAALTALEQAGGLSATSRASVSSMPRATQRQWDYPFGWAPHQILAWEGLLRHGFSQDAHRLTYRWLQMISRSAHDYHGTIPEKYDVVRRSHEVFAEYGNVGTDFSYITQEGFGWMNASFQLGRRSLPPRLWEALKNLQPPSEVPGIHVPR